MLSWWHRDVIAAGKLPLMLCFVSFVVTFASTRTITRLIRDGRGPFRNVSVGGTHVHHSVPGIILLMIGAFTAVGGPGTLGWRSFSAVAVGIGTSLVLDEFAMTLHLQDVYWSGEGQLSVEAVSLVAACLGLALVGFSPARGEGVGSAEFSLGISATGVLVIDACLALVCILKGKYRTGLFGLFLPPVGAIGAVRLARPNSIWARHRYRGKRLERAARRAAAFDRRWKPLQAGWLDFIGGKPGVARTRRWTGAVRSRRPRRRCRPFPGPAPAAPPNAPDESATARAMRSVTGSCERSSRPRRRAGGPVPC